MTPIPTRGQFVRRRRAARAMFYAVALLVLAGGFWVRGRLLNRPVEAPPVVDFPKWEWANHASTGLATTASTAAETGEWALDPLDHNRVVAILEIVHREGDARHIRRLWEIVGDRFYFERLLAVAQDRTAPAGARRAAFLILRSTETEGGLAAYVEITENGGAGGRDYPSSHTDERLHEPMIRMLSDVEEPASLREYLALDLANAEFPATEEERRLALDLLDPREPPDVIAAVAYMAAKETAWDEAYRLEAIRRMTDVFAAMHGPERSGVLAALLELGVRDVQLDYMAEYWRERDPATRELLVKGMHASRPEDARASVMNAMSIYHGEEEPRVREAALRLLIASLQQAPDERTMRALRPVFDGTDSERERELMLEAQRAAAAAGEATLRADAAAYLWRISGRSDLSPSLRDRAREYALELER